MSGITFFVACSDSSDGPGARAFDDDSGTESDGSAANLPPPSQDPVDSGVDAKPTPDASKDAAVPDYDASDEAVQCVDGNPCAVRLAAGERHVCALMNDGAVRRWGDNTKGAVGMSIADAGADPDVAPPPVDAGVTTGIAPRTVANITNATQISAADDNTCVRLADGTVQCWVRTTRASCGPPDLAAENRQLRASGGERGSAHRYGRARRRRPRHRLRGHGQRGAVVLGPERSRADAPTGRTDPAGPGAATLGTLSFAETIASNTTIYGKAADGALYSWGLVSGRSTSFLIDPAPRAIESFDHVVDFAVSSAQVDGTTGMGRSAYLR